MVAPDLKKIEQTLQSHPFVVPRFLQSRHIQTLLPGFVPYCKTPLPQVERRFIKLPDGSQLATDCWWQKEKEKNATIVVLSGFEGYQREKRSRFVTQTIYKGYHFGFNVIHLKQRGEGDTIHLTKSLMTYLENDLEAALKQLINWGIQQIYIIGFSSGGYASLFEIPQLESKIKKSILGLVTISAPLSLFDTWRHVERRKFYNWFLLRTYKHFIKRRLTTDPPGTWDIIQLKKMKTKRQLFETYMHKWGYPEKFSSLDDYHHKSNVIPLLSKIITPTLIINSYDDPISPIEPFTHITNPNIITLLTKHGGHGGFFMNKKLYGDLDGHWAQNRAIEFIRLLDKSS